MGSHSELAERLERRPGQEERWRQLLGADSSEEAIQPAQEPGRDDDQVAAIEGDPNGSSALSTTCSAASIRCPTVTAGTAEGTARQVTDSTGSLGPQLGTSRR
jgi:hypothetical protein